MEVNNENQIKLKFACSAYKLPTFCRVSMGLTEIWTSTMSANNVSNPIKHCGEIRLFALVQRVQREN